MTPAQKYPAAEPTEAVKHTQWDGAHHPNSNRTDKECCVRCGKVIKDTEQAVFLELNNADGEYRDERGTKFPPGESQGWFVFGATCAARTLEEQRQRHLAEMKSRRS